MVSEIKIGLNKRLIKRRHKGHVYSSNTLLTLHTTLVVKEL